MSSWRERVAGYYAGKLATYGATPRGVDWNSVEGQELRFSQLLELMRDDRDGSVLDFGCGYGALAARLRRDGHAGRYIGYDAAPEMIAAATPLPDCRYTADIAALEPMDYVIASGVFNVRLDASVPEWESYVGETIGCMAAMARRGFAFNMLTRYADADRMRPDLYYADPGAWLTHCLDRFGRQVSLRHDYPLYEFTILVRLEGTRG